MLNKAQTLKPRLVELRRTIHRNPELGFDVFKTADLVARTLSELGVEAQTGVGKTGVVGYIGDGDGPVIAIRADMDALPILEANQVEYASQAPGKMHACGTTLTRRCCWVWQCCWRRKNCPVRFG